MVKLDEIIRKPPFRLCLVTDRKLAGTTESMLEKIRAAIRGGIDAVQIREKDLCGKALYELARKVSENNVQVLVNGRTDVAAALPEAGVHLPGSGIPIREARKILGDGRLIGTSAHSIEDAKKAEDEGADYISFGPVYETESKKKYGQPQGISKLNEVINALGIPVIAIGGISPETAEEIMASGASGIAVVSNILGHPDPEKAARELSAPLGHL
jgi:thiamine-phosphate pyrophosphorylase